MRRTDSWEGVSYPGLGSIYLGYGKVRENRISLNLAYFGLVS